MVLAIILFLALIIFLICNLRVHLVILANEDVVAYFKILGYKFPLYPEPQEEINLKLFENGYPEYDEEDDEEEEEEESSPSHGKQKKASFKDTVTVVYNLVKLLVSRLGKYLRLDVSKIVITVGAEDAAQCAINYGVISQTTAYLLEFLDNNVEISKKHKSEINVLCDFTAQSTVYDIHIGGSLTVWQILDIIISLAYNYAEGEDIFNIDS